MKRLVEECLRFLHARFNSIVKLPIDLGCLNQSLLTRLARLFSDSEMDGLRDRKDKLLSKVYMHRTQFLLEDQANRLYVDTHRTPHACLWLDCRRTDVLTAHLGCCAGTVASLATVCSQHHSERQ